MSETKRKNFTGDFKAKVALETIRGTKTVMDGRGRALDNSSKETLINSSFRPRAAGPRAGIQENHILTGCQLSLA